MLHKGGRVFLIVLLAIAAVIALAAVLLPLLIPTGTVRAYIATTIEEQTHRPVSIGSVRAGLLPSPWVEVSDLKVGPAPGERVSRFSVAALTLSVRLLPLLQRRLEVTRIEITRPEVEVFLAQTTDGKRTAQPRRERSGSPPPPENDREAAAPGASAGDRSGAHRDAEQSASHDTERTAAGDSRSAPLDLQIQELRIEDGALRLYYPDGRPFVELAALNEQLTVTVSRAGRIDLAGETHIDSLRVYLPAGEFGQGISLHLNKRLAFDRDADQLTISEATLLLGDLPASLTGQVTGLTQAAPVADLRLAGGPASVADIIGYLPTDLFPAADGVRSTGTLSLAGELRGPLGEPDLAAPSRGQSAHFALDLTLADGRVEHPDLPAPVEGIGLRLHVVPDTLAVREFSARSAGSRLAARAMVTEYQTTPRLDAAIDAEIDLAAISPLLPPEDSLEIGGRGIVDVTLAGLMEDHESFRLSGRVRLENVRAQSPRLPAPMSEVNADLSLRGNELIVHNIAGALGSSSAQGSGRIGDYLALDPRRPADRVATIEFDLRSERLDLDELMVAFTSGTSETSGMPDASDAPASELAMPGPLAPLALLGRAEGRIVVAAREVIVNQTSFADVEGIVRLDRGRIHLDTATARAFGGRLAGNGLVDLRSPAEPHFNVTVEAQSVRADQLYGYAAGLSRFGRLAGYLSGTVDVSADMQGRLTDSLALELDTFSSTGTLQTESARFSGHPLQRSLATYLEMPQLETLSISDWVQPFQISNGRLTLDGMQLTADQVEVSARGWQALDGSIELALELLLSPEVSAQARKKVPAELAAILFDGSSDRVLVPLNIGGRLPQPSVSLDMNKLRGGLQRRAAARLEAERGRLQDQVLEQAGDLLDGLLGGRRVATEGSSGSPDTTAATAGQDSTAQVPTGRDSSDQDSTGQNSSGQNSSGQNSTGRDPTGQGSTGQDSTGQDSTGQDSTGQMDQRDARQQIEDEVKDVLKGVLKKNP
ncbi:MAG: AsmA family protein [Candidatus Eisenbacteria sp.]|nr:AsmA family protein [Candidatus Eisenbacteria bacterium]